jgi:predicted phage-related endonuclease
MNIITDCEQGTEEWMTHRVGSVGASSLDKIITSTGKRSTQRKKYMYQLAGEILTGQKAKSFSTPAMEEGIRREAESRELFEMIHEVEIEQIALMVPDNKPGWHISPDGLIDRSIGFEVKNPNMSTHVEYLDKAILPTKYKLQLQMSLYVSGYDKWWFMSHYPGLKPFIISVDRDDALITIIYKELKLFVAELNELVERLK